MSAVLSALVLYVVLIILFRCAGKRTLHDVTAFDFVLLLIIAEAAQQALTGRDSSITQALTVIATLVLADIILSLVKQRFRRIDTWLEGRPVILVHDGKPIDEAMRMSRVDREDVLEAARELQGLERLDQVRYAVLERDGRISIVPRAANA